MPDITAAAATPDIPIYGKHERIVGDDRKQVSAHIVARFQAGESIRDIYTSLGRSYGFVHRILHEANIPLRPRGGARRGKQRSGTSSPQ